MKFTLKQEAKLYSDKIQRSEDGLVEQSFIAGATSNFVQIQNIQSQINTLMMIIISYNLSNSVISDINLKIKRLELHIKTLQNESN